jgi:hypothetical protein
MPSGTPASTWGRVKYEVGAGVPDGAKTAGRRLTHLNRDMELTDEHLGVETVG